MLKNWEQSWQLKGHGTDSIDSNIILNVSQLCLNNGTCVNQTPGYMCTCTPEFYGDSCESNFNDCADDYTKCVNGMCVDQPRNETGVPNFGCVCSVGWRLGDDSLCTRDVNECLDSPCYIGVQCVNTPGSFYCGSCPNGYQGNGIQCDDINECLTNNGGCSQAPLVDCINTPGSFYCGPCPPGFEGNGYNCDPISPCNVNNGGCSPLASCQSAPELGPNGVSCTCPDGMVGNGFGPDGCMDNPPCSETCDPVGGFCFLGQECICYVGWTGVNCDIPAGEELCAANPCQNGGTCVPNGGSYYCECPPGFTGLTCNIQAEECGGNYVVDSGNVQYPSGSGSYPHNSNCVWYIEISRGLVVNVTFSEFTLEQSTNCNFDGVEIYDGANTQAERLGVYCGTTIPPPTITNSNYATIRFYADASVSRDGFRFHWQPAEGPCGGAIEGETAGSISSPNYPGNYPADSDCYWTIAVSSGFAIRFVFGSINIESHSTCAFDYLQIRDGLLPSSVELVKLCSSATPAPVETSGPGAWVHFHSDHSGQDTGFSLTWSAIGDPDNCGGILTDGEGTITSPGYPTTDYTGGDTCYWTISGVPGDQMALEITDMDIESTGNCAYDYLEVRDGWDEDSPLMGRFCGDLSDDLPSPLVASGNAMWVAFVSDTSIHGRGFSADYYTSCGGYYNQNGSILTSPGFPGEYNHNVDCIYNVVAPDDNVITLTFDLMDIEGINNDGDNLCYFDYVEIRDGNSGESPLLAKVCGDQTPNPVQSTGMLMWIRFKSDASNNGDGWRAQVTFGDTGGCGAVLTDRTGSFSSPGHPNPYPHGANCTWWINGLPGDVIQLDFVAFSLEAGSCNYDYVAIYDGIFGQIGTGFKIVCSHCLN